MKMNDIMQSITIATCNFNTTKLTNRLLSSIYAQMSNCNLRIVVLDNSDVIPFQSNYPNIKVIDNTKQQIINFNKMLQLYGGKTTNNYANMKHAMSIQFLLSIFNTRGLLLFDSDAMLKSPIDFIDFKYATIGGLQKQYIATWAGNVKRRERIVPYMQFFNIQMLNDFKLQYFNPMKIIGAKAFNSNQFDTGASFYDDLVHKKAPFKLIDHTKYIDHVCGASWAKKDKFYG